MFIEAIWEVRVSCSGEVMRVWLALSSLLLEALIPSRRGIDGLELLLLPGGLEMVVEISLCSSLLEGCLFFLFLLLFRFYKERKNG